VCAFELHDFSQSMSKFDSSAVKTFITMIFEMPNPSNLLKKINLKEKDPTEWNPSKIMIKKRIPCPIKIPPNLTIIRAINIRLDSIGSDRMYNRWWVTKMKRNDESETKKLLLLIYNLILIWKTLYWYMLYTRIIS